MASSYTGLGTELMTTGENAGVWGTTTNTNLQIIEQISGGYTEQDIAGSADTTTLSVSDGSTGAVLGHRIIKFTGTITGNQIVTIPLDVQQMYVLVNGTSGAYTVQFKYASGSGSSVTFAATDKGTKIVYATADHATNPNLVDTGISSTGAHDLDGNEFILDADADTSITADTDDQIDIKIAGADDFQFTANTFTAQSGSTIAAQALTATTVTASGIVKTDDTTEATSTTDGSLQTDGGLSVAKDAVLGDDLKLLSDSAVLSFGADSDTTLTHTDGTGLTLNSTNKLLFRDTGLYINSSTDGQLDLVADTEIQIAATTIDINGAIAMDGAITGATNITLSGELDAATLDISGNADIDGTTNLDAVDIDGAVQLDSTFTVGVNDTGYDVKFFGATSGAYMLWDESTDDLVLAGAAKLYLYDAAGGEYISSSGSALTLSSGGTAWELPAADGSDGQVLKTDGSGNLDWTTMSANTPSSADGQALGSASLEWSDLFLADSSTIQFGNDQDTTLTHTDGTGLTLNSTNKLCFNDTSQFIQGSSNAILALGATDEIDLTATAVDLNGTLDVSGNSQFSGTITVGVDDTGLDVKFFGASAGAYMEWDESEDQLRIMGASADATTSTGKLLLATSLTDINANDVIGKIDFQAPHEAGGTDAITVAASIQALAQATFSSSVNATDLIFYTGHSEAATEKFRFTSQGEIGVGGANYGTDGQVLTSGGAGAAPAWEDASGGADPPSADGDTLGTASAEWSDLYLADGSVIYFGNDQEITLTHAADDGLILKHVGTGDGKEPSLTFQAGDNDIAVNDVLGSIFFQAPDEGAGTDAIAIAAGIEAVAEGDFSSSSNATSLVFKTGASEAATAKVKITSAGHLVPNADDTYDLGTASLQWRNIYTGDLNLSNMSKTEGNKVDGTKGNWTVQEGDKDLYLINNNSGRKYKFKLEEI